MRVLLDACVLSEIHKPKGNRSVKHVVDSIPSPNLYLSVITVGEMIKEIELLPDGKRKSDLQRWIYEIERDYSESILSIDLETVHIWGSITANAQKKGFNIPISDGLIAATAIQHGLFLMTRNLSDFEHTGVMIINPWSNISE